MKWYKFDKSRGSRQKRPPERRNVLVKTITEESARGHVPHPIAVGYRRDAAGDKQSPYFVVPGIGGEVYEWCDCLGGVELQWNRLASAN